MRCQVKNCRNNSSRIRGKSFFRFPKNPELRQKWMEAIGCTANDVSIFSVICADHFREEEVISIGVRRNLTREAIPRISTENQISDSPAETDISAQNLLINEVINFGAVEIENNPTIASWLPFEGDLSQEPHAVALCPHENYQATTYWERLEDHVSQVSHDSTPIPLETYPENFLRIPLLGDLSQDSHARENYPAIASWIPVEGNVRQDPQPSTSLQFEDYPATTTWMQTEGNVGQESEYSTIMPLENFSASPSWMLLEGDLNQESNPPTLVPQVNPPSISSWPQFEANSIQNTRPSGLLRLEQHSATIPWIQGEGNTSQMLCDSPSISLENNPPAASIPSLECDCILERNASAALLHENYPSTTVGMLEGNSIRDTRIPMSLSHNPSNSFISQEPKIRRSVKSRVDEIQKNLTIDECLITTGTESESDISEEVLVKKAKLMKLRKTIKKRDTSLKRANQTVYRQRKKIIEMSALLRHLTAKNFIDDHLERVLSDIVGPTKDFLHRYIRKVKSGVVEKQYSENLRLFALNLNFMSPKGYAYVRSTFHNCLPHPRTISQWYRVLDCAPGFTNEALQAIKNACKEASSNDEKLTVNLVFDEMSIRQHVDWDGERSFGFIDMGDGGRSLCLASQIFVLMVVALNRSWKIPIGFFPITSLTGEQKANLIRLALQELSTCGVEVIGITFDGAYNNLGAMKLLGCDLRNIAEPSQVQHELCDAEYIVHPDPCHMVKLIRNTLGDLKSFRDSNEEIVEWFYLERLVFLQEKEQLHLGNKIRQAHIYFAKKKMNVKLATQLFSESVADALEFCDDVLALAEFKGNKPLIKFIRIIDNSFDILNSRKLAVFEPFKRALCETNAIEVLAYAEYSVTYISQLKTMSGELLIDSGRKTGFIGLIAALKNVTYLRNKYIMTKKLRFLPMYKLNQDHLELFFGSIRMHLGHNNNPSVRQFIAAYKKLLVRCQIREGGVENCMPLESIKILNLGKSPSNENTVTLINASTERSFLIEKESIIKNDDILDQQFFQEHNYVKCPTKLSDYVHHVVYY